MSGAVTATLVAVGVGAETAAIAAPFVLGAAVGAVGSAVTGGNPLLGALGGGITGGFGELGGLAGDAIGIGSDAGGAIGGALGGVAGAGITGGNPLIGALTGGAGGLFGQMSQNGDLSSLFGGDSTPTLPADAGATPSSANTDAGPPVQATNNFDPNNLDQLAAAASSPTPGSTSTLSGLSDNPDMLSAPTAANGSLSGSLSTPNLDGTGSSAAGTALMNGTTAPYVSSGLAPTVANAPAADSTSSWQSLSNNPISNYLFGSGTPTTPPTQTLQQALNAQASSGTAQAFNGGVVQANGTVSYAPVGAGGAGAGTGTAAKSGGSLLGALGGNSSGGGVFGNALSSITSNPLQAALLGTQLYSMSQAPALPTLAQQQAASQGPTFSANLPQYTATQTRNPIADYYTYGYSPQPTQISTTLTPTTGQGTGNAPISLAVGGFARPRLPGAPHLGTAPRRNSGAGLAQLGALSHMRRAGAMSAPAAAPASPMGGGALSAGPPMMARGGLFARQGQVQMGTGTKGQADKVPAYLSEDEFVMPADVVSSLGDGSSDAGGGVLQKFVANVRAHKAQTGKDGMPPRAKSPEQYLRRA